jgi:amylosucrase
MISVGKEVTAFADFNNRELHDTGNPHLFALCRVNYQQSSNRVRVVGSLDAHPQHAEFDGLKEMGIMQYTQLYDLYSGEKPAMLKNALGIPPYRLYWLQTR